jgi:tRNA G18 (ribose-2'-O)-methylase SpoU
MVRIEHVSDPLDPRLHDFIDLRDVRLRARLEPAEGLFLAEGETTIRRALAAGYELRSVLCTERWLPRLADVLDPSEGPALVVNEDVLTATTGFPVHRGAIGSFARRPTPSVEDVLHEARRAVVLEDLTDHTNVGAILRSALALGMDAALLTPRCADPLYRRAVRTSMGAVFSLPWTRIDWREGPSILRDRGWTLAALTPAPEAEPIGVLSGREPLALAVGAEGPGLSRHWLHASDLRVRIPMRDAVDSLNAAAAAAVAFFAIDAAR